MKLANFTVEHRKVLPLRAIVAFAAQCARRAETLSQPPEGNPHRESRREEVEAALRMTESFAWGRTRPPTNRWLRRSTRAGTSGASPPQGRGMHPRPGGPFGGVRLA